MIAKEVDSLFKEVDSLASYIFRYFTFPILSESHFHFKLMYTVS
jgi:hypothetical protein